jgi:molecular chaperone HtpG
MNERHMQKIPFEVEVSRVIEVLAKQIYQTPLALLRENAQNAFDAILLRRHQIGPFTAQVAVDISEAEIVVSDNGIGMTAGELRAHYWRAGSSGKNNPEARAAGVVGTFGIGAMANFGIADELVVETESAVTGERTRSSAQRETLSTTEECIEVAPMNATGSPGTTVRARISEGLDVGEATGYITDFVAFVDVPVLVNGTLVSRQALIDQVPPPSDAEEFEIGDLTSRLSGTAKMRVTGAGEVWVAVHKLGFDGQPVLGQLILRQGQNAIRTFRSGFGLAVATVRSQYNFGGVADIAVLEPTAGREALTTASLQTLQEVVTSLDELVSLALGERPESTNNTAFMEWVRAHGRYDLCGYLLARFEPGQQLIALDDVKARSESTPILVYGGTDRSIIDATASDDSPLLLLTASNPRRQCEQQFLERYCRTEEIVDAPTVIKETPRELWSLAEQALVFRIAAVLQSDYFLTADVALGELSHELPIVVIANEQPARLVLDPNSATFGVMRELYDTDYVMFGSMVKDYVRNVVFPRVSDLVPSSTRQGAEAFLHSIRRTRDVFEYEADDLESFSRIWDEYLKGTISMGEAAQRSVQVVQQSVQVFEPAGARRVVEVVPDVAESQALIGSPDAGGTGAAPPILRTDVSTEAKLLTVGEDEQPIAGYRCFIALSDRAREERGEFFLQPHSTSIVWGGQKVLFVFEHHSGEFGLYYDLQAAHVVSPESGGGPFATATIVLQNKVFIPVPDVLAHTFVPGAEERKRFDIRCDLLYTEHGSTRSEG